jgi:hypothetical protein
VRSRFTVRAGDFTGVLLESAQKSTVGHGEMINVFLDTVNFWKSGCTSPRTGVRGERRSPDLL